jgi:hypothetical protein
MTRTIRLHVAVAVVLAVVAASLVTAARSAFFDTTGTGATLTTLDCFEARLGSVQTGTATSTANGTLTVSITEVDPSKSFLIFTSRHDSDRPVGSMIRGRLNAAGNAVEFVRVTNESTPVPMSIRWYVMEYACGVSVQRGEVAQSATTVNVPIASVGSTAQAFVLWSKTPNSGDGAWGSDDPLLADLTSPTNLQFRVDSANAAHTIAWQVVAFTHPSYASVQRGTTSITGSSLSATVDLPTPVDVDRTFVLVDYRSSGGGADIGSRMLRARLVDSTTIVIDRSVSGSPDHIEEIVWQAVELRDGSRVQHGSEAFASGTTQRVVGIDPIDVDRSAAFGSVQAGSGQNMGRSPYVGDDIVGVSNFTADLTADTLTLTRDNTAASADVGWFVVEWGGPAWWDDAYAFRAPIDVATGSSAIASGYTLSLTFDHAALVADGKSQAGGDDIRIVHWDGSDWVELDRILDEGSAWNSDATTLWFRAVPAVAADSTYRSHYLYFSNPDAVSPPADAANVWLFFEDFESGTLDDWVEHEFAETWYTADQDDWYEDGSWYGAGWGHRRTVTIDASKVAATLTDFPVLISVTDTGLRDNAQASGADILFTAADGLTKLAHEIEYYDASTGTLVAWVKVPSLSGSTDTALYLYYGNAGASDQQNVAQVWTNGYAAVWHLNENPAGTAPQMKDRTANANHATAFGSMPAGAQVTGQIDGALQFDGTDDVLRIPNSASTDITGNNFTLSAWVRPTNVSARDQAIISKAHEGGSNVERYHLGFNANGSINVRRHSGSLARLDGTAGQIVNNQWYYLVGVYDGSTLRGYINGVDVASMSATGNITSSTEDLLIGKRYDNRFYEGRIDEPRVSTVARSAAWIQAEYNNQSNPGTFHTLGIQESPGSWAHRKTITVDAAQVAGDLTNFPVLVSITDTDLRDQAQASGNDILFTAADGTTRLAHEIEYYDAGTGTLVAWVKLPTLSGSTDTTILMYYGHPGAGPQASPHDVWSNGFAGVWHLGESGSGAVDEFRDSTSNRNHGRGGNGDANKTPTRVAGVIGDAQQFDGSNDFIRVADDASLDLTSALTVSLWVKVNTFNLQWQAPLAKGNCTYQIRRQSTTNTLVVALRNSSCATIYTESTAVTGNVNDGNWHHVAFTYSSAENRVRVYQNGSLISDVATSGTMNSDAAALILGAWADGSDRWWNGLIDEVRIAGAVRSAAWLQTEHANQGDPASFLDVGDQQTFGAGHEWGFRKAVMIDSSQVEATLTDFPVLVSVTDTGLRDQAQANGGDILFTAADGTTRLAHEIESFDSDTGTLVAWVKVPTLSGSTDTTLYLYYGNPAANDQQDVAQVWTNGYVAVWHFDEDPSGAAPQMRDRTTNANHGTAFGMSAANQVPGKIDGALGFDGTDDVVRVPNSASTNITGNTFTLSAWVYPVDIAGDTDAGIISKAHESATNVERYHLGINRNGSINVRRHSGTLARLDGTAGEIVDDQWQYLVGVYDGTTLRGYVDGVDVASMSATGNITSSTEDLLIAKRYDTRHYTGGIDEPRIANVARSAAWIQTEYNNQSNPGTFHTLGAQETPGGAEGWQVTTDQSRSGTHSLQAPTVQGAHRWITAAGIDEADLLVEAHWRLSTVDDMEVAQAQRTGTAPPIDQYETTLVGTAGWNVARMLNGTWTEILEPPAGQDPQAGTWTKVTTIVTGTNMRVLVDGAQAVPSVGWSTVGGDLTSGSLGFRVWHIPAGERWWIDDVIARRYVDPEPTASLATSDRP